MHRVDKCSNLRKARKGVTIMNRCMWTAAELRQQAVTSCPVNLAPREADAKMMIPAHAWP